MSRARDLFLESLDISSSEKKNSAFDPAWGYIFLSLGRNGVNPIEIHHLE